MTLTTIRHRLLNLLAGNTIEDLEIDESIYPMTINGDIAVKTIEGNVDLFAATAVINNDQSLTLAARGQVIAYYPTGSYEGVAAL